MNTSFPKYSFNKNSSFSHLFPDIISLFVFIAIESTIFIGNGLVILAVMTTKRLQTVTNLYVISLAFSDVFVSVFVLPFAIVVQIRKQWPLTSFACKLWLSSDICLCTSSILNLCCISIDRYMAITQPLKYATQRSKRLARFMIISVWILAFSISIPGMYGWTKHISSTTECLITLNKGYRVFSAFCSFILPFLIIIFVYIRIFWIAYKRRLIRSPEPMKCYLRYKTECQPISISFSHIVLHGIPDNQVKENNNLQKILQVDYSETVNIAGENLIRYQIHSILKIPKIMNFLQRVIVHSVTEIVVIHLLFIGHCSQLPKLKRRVRFNENDKMKRERAAFRKEHKTAKTLALVVGCFSICWLPFFCVYLIEPFCKCTINVHLVTFVTWLGYANSVFNPFIYAFYNKEYAVAFRRLICALKKS